MNDIIRAIYPPLYTTPLLVWIEAAKQTIEDYKPIENPPYETVTHPRTAGI